jgi:uncharacterized protein YigE (DUF2233 family)
LIKTQYPIYLTPILSGGANAKSHLASGSAWSALDGSCAELCFAAEPAKFPAGYQMTLDVESIVDGGVHRKDRKMKAVGVLLLIGLLSFVGGQAFAQSPPCASVTFEASDYTVCEVDLRKQSIRLYWKRSDGVPYAYLRALPQSAEGNAGRLMFAINAGMFDPQLKPVGLYIERGRELVRASTRSGFGNFHLKPNGVFFVTGNTAGVMETGAYLKKRLRPDLATQSGPMLVINGKIHPRFDRNSMSLKVRSGVGLKDAHTVLFAISDGNVSFDAFARLFKDHLKSKNALFLDGGSAPSLYAPSPQRSGNFLPLGPMIGVFGTAVLSR